MRSHVLPFVSAILICTVMFLALPLSARGDGLDVPAEYATIALAFAGAAPEDSVVLAPGTYYESGLSMPDSIKLMSSNGNPYTTVIDGGTTRGTILLCTYLTDAVVQGVGFTNGVSAAGGAAYVDNSSVIFDYCLFQGNMALDGGAVYWTGGTPELVGCVFSSNQATGDGGGLYLKLTGGSVTGCTFFANDADAGGGACVQYITTTTTFTECSFAENTCLSPTSPGGGVYVDNQATPTFIQCRFDDNDAAYGGGAYLGDGTGAAFQNCDFEANSASMQGGGMYCTNDNTEVDGCGFLLNHVSTGGGGIHCTNGSMCGIATSWFHTNDATWGGAIESVHGAVIDIAGCTIVKNSAYSGTGGGIFVSDDATATVDETIIAFNTSGEAVACNSGSTATLTCCNLWGNAGGDWVGCVAGQDILRGNMTANPLFCGMSYYDLYLCEDSPCLYDAPGNNCGVLVGAFDDACPACSSPVQQSTWGSIKALYR